MLMATMKRKKAKSTVTIVMELLKKKMKIMMTTVRLAQLNQIAGLAA